MGDQPREPKGTPTGGRFARLPGPMDDDLADPTPVSPLTTTKGLAALLYRMGVTFDGLNTSRMATEEFLRTGDPRVIGSRDDYALLQDLRDAAEYTLGYDYDMEPFDMDWLRGINASMTRTAAMLPGEPRTERNVIVRTPDGIYTPPIPDSGALAGWLDEACRERMMWFPVHADCSPASHACSRSATATSVRPCWRRTVLSYGSMRPS